MDTEKWGRSTARARYGSEGMKKMASGGGVTDYDEERLIAARDMQNSLKESPSNSGETGTRTGARKRLSSDPFEAVSYGATELEKKVKGK